MKKIVFLILISQTLISSVFATDTKLQIPNKEATAVSSNQINDDKDSLNVRPSGFVEAAIGYVGGSLRPTVTAADPARYQLFIRNALTNQSNIPFLGNAGGRAACNGFSGGIYGGWFCKLSDQSNVIIGAKFGGALLKFSGKANYPTAGVTRLAPDIIYGVSPTFAKIKLSDKWHLDAVFNVGIISGRTLFYVSFGWSGHRLSGKVLDSSGATLYRLGNKMAHCLLTGVGIKVNVTNKISVGCAANIPMLGKSLFKPYKNFSNNFASQFGGLKTKVRCALLECLATVTYMMPTK